MIGGNVVTQYRQRTHPFQGALTCQRPFPIGWTANIGAHRAPIIEWVGCLLFLIQFEHLNVNLLKLLRFHVLSHHLIDLFITWPEIFQVDRFTVGIVAERIALNIKAD